jgi:hypothetical protein
MQLKRPIKLVLGGVVALVVLVVLVVGGTWLYINVIEGDPPDRLTLEAKSAKRAARIATHVGRRPARLEPSSIQLQVQHCHDHGAREQQPEEEEERPAEAEVPPGELGVHQTSTGSSAAAVKSSAS